MKRKNVLFLFLLVIVSVGSVACSDSSEPTVASLVGTKWKIEDNYSSIFLNFYTETTGQMIFTENGVPDSGPFTYTYNSPKVNLTLPNGTITGTISGNSMSVTIYTGSQSASFTLTKQ